MWNSANRYALCPTDDGILGLGGPDLIRFDWNLQRYTLPYVGSMIFNRNLINLMIREGIFLDTIVRFPRRKGTEVCFLSYVQSYLICFCFGPPIQLHEMSHVVRLNLQLTLSHSNFSA